MFTNDLWQPLQYGNKIFYIQVYSGTPETQGAPYVLLEDVQDHFPDAANFMCDGHLVSWMRDTSDNRLMPERFAHRPGVTLKIVTTGICTSLSRDSQGSGLMSPRQLTRQTTIFQSTSVDPVVKGNFQQSVLLYEDYIKSIKEGQKEQADLIRSDFQQCFLELKLSMAKNHDLQQQMSEMQQLMLQMQQQALDRLAVIQGRVQALLTQTYELHEYPIPRLFIVLPKDTSKWDPAAVLNNQFRLYFLCECSEHNKVLNGDNTNIPHHIHLAKHEGYDLQRPKEFFQKYGRYMLTLLEMIKYGVTIAGFAVPPLAAVSAPTAIDMFKNSLDTLSQSAVNQSIEYLQEFASNDSGDKYSATNLDAKSFSGQEALEGADLRHLEAFIKDKDKHRVLGNLYRTVTQEGHVKWVCIDHFRLSYKEKEQQEFANAVELNGGVYEPQLGHVSVWLRSKTSAVGFFNALAKARSVDDLDITLDWGCTGSDLKSLEDALKKSRVSTLRLDLYQFRISRGSKLFSTSAQFHALLRIMEHPNMKTIHIVLPRDFVKLSHFQPKRQPHRCKLSLEMAASTIVLDELYDLAMALKINSTLTILDLRKCSVGDKKTQALAEALKANTTLTNLNLGENSIEYGAVALAEALKTNSTLTTLNLGWNSIGDNGAVALSEALKSNSALTTLNLEGNVTRDNGAVALSKAIKINSTLTTLDLLCNRIGENGAIALSEALKSNSTLTTLNLEYNAFRTKGAAPLSDKIKISSTFDMERGYGGDGGAMILPKLSGASRWRMRFK
ncbi:hypothetical protein BGX28_010383 [Mortierella sp. GBA30]|nr:hypothetical protein BGX28_010383 [Mortierella sp. GBA30]